MTAAVLATLTVSAALAPVCEEAGVTVYRNEEAAALELVAEGDFEASPAAVQHVLVDYGERPSLAAEIRESRVIAREEQALLVYERLGLPFVSDRDYTFAITWGGDDECRWARFTTANDRGPAPVDGVVRMPLHEAEWRLWPRAGGAHTHARYSLRMDLGGTLPAWLWRSGVGRHVPSLFAAVRRELAR